MKNHTLLTSCAMLMSIGFGISTAYSDAVTVTGSVVNSGQLMSGTNLQAGQTQGPNAKVYLESSNLTLPTGGVYVDRIGPVFGTFTNFGSGGGTLPAGTVVTDYLIHYDAPGSGQGNNITGSVMFSQPILGLILFNNNHTSNGIGHSLDNSDSILGVSGVTYSNNEFRGLDDSADNNNQGNDNFSVSGDMLTFDISGWTTVDQIDEVRVIVAVPDGGSTAALLGLSFLGLLGAFRLRKSVPV